MEYLHHTSFGIGVLGVLVIVFGVVAGVLRFVRTEFRAAAGANVAVDRHHLRHALGYYLLLGLEILIAADIIDTLMKPSVQDLIVLGAIVLIRTVISYSLNAELRSEQTSPNAAETSRRYVPVHEPTSGTFAPLDARRMGQRAVPVQFSP